MSSEISADEALQNIGKRACTKPFFLRVGSFSVAVEATFNIKQVRKPEGTLRFSNLQWK